ncbi:tRNA (adenosine(37)-N6)-dimethylallyltransferase MiaA [Tistrella mobilis]|uniref:tRNA (adenosine(37)-N6)-dimethylallyltransferase MiaA n=1 Tax=Tistrella mobilis TaxID=171437 RepID=UPI003558FBB2
MQRSNPAPAGAGPLIVVMGPTASGKSQLALDLARARDGVVINADAMQVYADLRIVTARPSEVDEAAAPHRLYGVRPAGAVWSAADWAAAARAEIAAAHEAGRLPLITGGTGLYIRALIDGLSDLPAIPQDLRDEVRALGLRGGVPALKAALAPLDPVAALRLADPQRLARALEVVRATGRSLADWQRAHPPAGGHAGPVFTIALMPDAGTRDRAIAGRFVKMLEMGAADEVAAFLARGLDPQAVPLMKAVGVPEIGAWLAGEVSRDEMLERGRIATRQYAKRQMTWIRNQAHINLGAHEQYSECLASRIFLEIDRFLLTLGH